MMRVAGLWLALALFSGPVAAQDRLRIATFNTELKRDGPGLLLRDISRGKDAQLAAVVEVITTISPDILVVQGIDWDYDTRALEAFAKALEAAGAPYPHLFSARPNRGVPSGHDLNANGRLGEAADNFGYGTFTGQGGVALLSRYPIRREEMRDFSGFLWRDLPGHMMPETEEGTPFPTAEAQAVLPLSGSVHWVVPVDLPGGRTLSVLTYHAVPPVFDGPEDMNGRRNHDEARFWSLFLDGAFGDGPGGPFVLAGSATMDPFDSDGRPEALRALLADPRLQDPQPVSEGGARAPDQGHRGANALDTVDWPDPGRLRVDYVLPSADLRVEGAGVYWPAPGQPGHDAALSASRHRLVWVDVTVPPTP